MTDGDTMRTRRSIIAAGVGAAAAFVAQGVGRAQPVAAANGDPFILGQLNSASSATSLTTGNSVAFAPTSVSSSGRTINATASHATGATIAVQGSVSSSVGVGVKGLAGGPSSGDPGTAVGVLGASLSASGSGVVGQSSGNSTGVMGFSGVGSPPAAVAKVGVYGNASQDSTSRGVRGDSTSGTGVAGISSSGSGVRGESISGVGVFAQSATGPALQVQGKVKLSMSGTTSLVAGMPEIDITVSGVTPTSLVVAVLATNLPGISVRAVVPGTGKFTAYFSSALTANATLTWVVLG